MKITILATLLMMLAYFLVLYGAVGFIQDKRFFGSAPKKNLAAIPDKKERFPGAHGIGWGIEAIAVLHRQKTIASGGAYRDCYMMRSSE